MKRCTPCGREYPDSATHCPHCLSVAHIYEPSRDEIEAACEAIQATWSPGVRRQRYYTRGLPVEIERVRRCERATGRRTI